MILGIETATLICAAAIVDNGKIIAEKYLMEPHIHSEKLITIIGETLLKVEPGKNKDDMIKKINAVSVSIGPGSFTGLRIGLSVAKGIAFACDKPIVTAPTLEALAYNVILSNQCKGTELICPILDARRDDFFTVIYKYENNKLQPFVGQSAYLFDDIIKLIPEKNEIIFVGEGTKKFRKLASENKVSSGMWNFIDGISNLCSAGSVAMLGEIKFKQCMFENIADLEPDYIKEFYTLYKTHN